MSNNNNEINDYFRKNNNFINILAIFKKDIVGVVALYIFIALIILTILGNFISPYSAYTQFIGAEFTPPSWYKKGSISYFFGTDDIGRDILSRIILGAKYSLGSAFIITIIVGIIGGLIGFTYALNRKTKTNFLRTILDMFLAIPSILIAIIIATLMHPSLNNAILAIILSLLPHFVNNIHQAISQELDKEYITLLRLDGANNIRLAKSIILPKISPFLIRELARNFNIALLDICALSFLSLGANELSPEWGAMIKDALPLIYLAPWALIIPGIMIIISLLVVLVLTQRLSNIIEKYYE